MAARKYDPEGTRRAILAAARRTFVAKGVGETSIADIAREAGVTKSLIHHHFGSKDDLWQAVKAASFEQYFSAMLEIIRSEGEGDEPLRRAMAFTFRFHQEHRDMGRMLSWMHLDGDPAKHPLHEQVAREGLERIRRAQREGVFRDDVDAVSVQAGFLVLASAYFQQKAMFETWQLGAGDPGGDLDARYLRDMLKIFFEGLLARGPQSSPSAPSAAE